MQGLGKTQSFQSHQTLPLTLRFCSRHVLKRTKPKPPLISFRGKKQTKIKKTVWFLRPFLCPSYSCYYVLNFSCQETATASFLFPFFTSAPLLVLVSNTAFYSNLTLSLTMTPHHAFLLSQKTTSPSISHLCRHGKQVHTLDYPN